MKPESPTYDPELLRTCMARGLAEMAEVADSGEVARPPT